MSDAFWGALAIVAVGVLMTIGMELWDRVKAKNQRFTNQYLHAREKQNATDRLLENLYPTTKGPHGFQGQNERRPTTKKEMLRATRTTDGQPRNLTASTASAGAWPLSEKKARIP